MVGNTLQRTLPISVGMMQTSLHKHVALHKDTISNKICRYMSVVLKKTQMNDTALAVRAAGFSSKQFVWGENASSSTTGRVPVLFMKDTPYSFSFDHHDPTMYDPDHYRVARMRPGRETVGAYQKCGSWIGMLDAFNDWLNYIKEEISQPDLWNDDDSEEYLAWVSENAAFTADEQRVVIKAIDALEVKLLDMAEKSAEVQEDIKNTLNEIRQSTNRLGRKDFINALIGAITAKLLDWGINHFSAIAIFHFLVNAANNKLPFLN